jgi:isopropylmalate/homocitrate/citramalate synthase
VRVDPEENLRMIADSVAFLVGEGKRVIYDAEHFFDAWRTTATTPCAACAPPTRRARRT